MNKIHCFNKHSIFKTEKRLLQVLYSIVFVSFTMAMLFFLGIINFNYTFFPLIFGTFFLIFYNSIHLHLSNFTTTLCFFFTALIISFSYDKMLIINNLYQYSSDLLAISNIPIIALLIWAAAIAQAYNFNNGILYALTIDKPIFQRQTPLKSISKLCLLLTMDGFHLLTIGIFMEYLIVKNGFGTWTINTNNQLFDLPIFYVLASYFIVGFSGNSIFRCYEFFTHQNTLKPFKSYLNIFGSIYLVCFLISTYVLYDVNFSPTFVVISIVMLLTIVINDKIHRKKSNRDKN